MLPTLTVNRSFMRELLAADAPCFALGLVEERQRLCGFLALRPETAIPENVTGLGFQFGHSLLGTAEYEIIQFVFRFYGFATYNVLVNPTNPIVQTVLTTMVASGDYFFFALSPTQSVTAFRSELGQTDIAGLASNLPRIQQSRTTEAQYRRAVAQFARHPEPEGTLLHWACRENMAAIDPLHDRLPLTPA